MAKPQIIIEDPRGYHNNNPETQNRLIKGNTYKDISTICVVPVVGITPKNGKEPIPLIHGKIVQNWMGLMSPMNQKFIKIFLYNMEVADAYNAAVQMIVDHPDLSKWKYILTMETDNMVPPDGLLKLVEGMGRYDAIGGLYFTKGEGGQPMIYGDPAVMPKNFMPQIPQPEMLQGCNGLGMGFTLFKISMFKKVPKPWFKTLQEVIPGQGASCYTQDLYFFEQAAKYGFRFACDTRVKVGHYDYERDIVW